MHTRSRAPAWSSFYAGKNKVKLVSTFHNIYGHENKFKKIYNSGLAKMDKIIAISNFVKNGIIKLYNVKKVLEVGTFTGYSALTMALSIKKDGLITCLDKNKETSIIANNFFKF